MDICLHYFCKLVVSKVISLYYIQSNFLTKPSGRITIQLSLVAIGVTISIGSVMTTNGTALCLAAQSNRGCWIISADQENRVKGCKRKWHVTSSSELHVTSKNNQIRTMADLSFLLYS